MPYQDPHYTLNKATGEMTFDKTHRFYEYDRKGFALNGVDISQITDYTQYCEYRFQFRHEVDIFFREYMRQKEAKTLYQKYLRAMVLGNEKEAQRLEAILDRMDAANLKVEK